MSTLKTNAIQTVAGKPILNSTGSILQVVQTVKTDTFSTSGFSWADVTGLSVSITPSSSSSKILVMLDTKVGSDNDYGVNLRLVRGSTPIYLGDLNGTRLQVSSWASTYSNASSTRGYNMTSVALNYLDSPATTTATIYKIQLSSYTGSGPAYINRTHQWQQGGASGYDGCPPSSITVMEISG